jgi:hypothetical protein
MALCVGGYEVGLTLMSVFGETVERYCDVLLIRDGLVMSMTVQ